MRIKVLSVFSLIAIFGFASIYVLNSQNESKYIPRENSENIKQKSVAGAIEWLKKRQVNQITGKIDLKDVLKAQNQARLLRAKKSIKTVDLAWIEMGPDNVGGRTRAVLIEKNNPNLIFAGGVSGGLWKSANAGQSWVKVTSTSDNWNNLNIASICQAANGDIYVGTGEGLYTPTGDGAGGFNGQGIWKSTDLGTTWTRLTSTWATTTDQGIFIEVNKLAADPTNSNRIYAATKKSLRVSNDGGLTWKCPLAFTYQNRQATDVKVASDGTVIASVGNLGLISATGDSATFTKISSTSSTSYKTDSLINPTVGRLEFAFSPDDPNYIYCSSVKQDGTTEHIYRSINKGQTWKIIASGDEVYFDPFRNQGIYDNIITVFPGNKNKILLGGIDIWEWELGKVFEQKTLWSLSQMHQNYVHADIHTIVFHPNYLTNKTFYVGSDGGISKTTDGGISYFTRNKNYNVTQAYATAFSPTGEIILGTQDNGTQYIGLDGNTVKTATEVSGGDGGYCEFSTLNPNVTFGSVYFTDVRISLERGVVMDEFYFGNGGNFVTPLRLWESFNDIYSTDSIEIFIEGTIKKDSIINLKSKINNRPIKFIADRDYTAQADTIVKVQDSYQAAIAIGYTNSILFARNPLNLTTPEIDAIAENISGTVQTIEFSADGNYIYAGTENGNLYRIDSVLNIRKPKNFTYSSDNNNMWTVDANLIGTFGGRVITSIAVNPKNPEEVTVTVGNYGNSNYVYYSKNAATTTTSSGNFTAKQGNLPQAPVYSSLIDWQNDSLVYVGTETGVYYTENIYASTVEWIPSEGFPTVPTYMLRQQSRPNSWLTGVTNHGYIYAATHGRGIWRSESRKGPLAVKEIDEHTSSNNFGIKVYPNPVVDLAKITFNNSEKSNINLVVYDLSGKLILTKQFSSQLAGERTFEINTSNLKSGTYIVKVENGKTSKSSKFLKY